MIWYNKKTYANVFAKDVMYMSVGKYKNPWGKLHHVDEPDEAPAAAAKDAPPIVKSLKDVFGQLKLRGYVVNTRAKRNDKNARLCLWVVAELNASGNFVLIAKADEAASSRKVAFEVLCNAYIIGKAKLHQVLLD